MPVDSPYPEQIANSANLPDVQQYVDTYDAAHMNNVRAFIRDMTAAIGTDPQGNCSDLTTRLVDVVSADGKPITPSRIVTVAKDNGQFESIQDAIDSITDASPNKRYTILVYPGIYTENISPKEYVDIVGASMIMQDYESAIDPVAQIQPASGHCIDNTGASNLRMSNILFKFTDASVITRLSGAFVHLVNCKVYGSSSTLPALFDTGYCDVHARNCSFQLSENAHPLIKFNDAINRSVHYRFIGCHIRGIIEPVIAGDNTVYFDLSSSMFFGHLYSNNWYTSVSLFFSFIEADNSAPLSACTGTSFYSKFRINMRSSTLIFNDSGSTIQRISGTYDVKLNSCFSCFNEEHAAYIDESLSNGYNIIGEWPPYFFYPL